MANGGVTYHSETAYIRSASDLKSKIQRIDNIIEALEDVILNAAGNQDISSYSVDDGQTSINTSYRNVEEAEAAVERFERRRQKYLNQLNGRQIRLMDENNFKKWR